MFPCSSSDGFPVLIGCHLLDDSAFSIHKRYEKKYMTTFLAEIIGLSILWVFWIAGAAVASGPWGNLSWCQHFETCRVLSALVAFAWLGWLTITVLLGLSLLFSIANKSLLEPFHGRWNPRQSHYGDNVSRVYIYQDPIIAELLVTSVLAMLFSCWFIAAILGKLRNPLSKYISEHISLFIIWVMFLIGAAITTVYVPQHKWLHLKHCRSHFKVCRILETIKAFSWMCFIISTFLLIASLISMLRHKRTLSDPLYGEDDYGTYPETRQARAAGTATTTTAYNNVQPTSHNVGTTNTVPHNATTNVHTHEV
ncbi:hypothetical protein CVT25_013131 [Psilocybe cyanescens]|uniref:MARVEL domain-containing protein n=1 Tax=Psilocybe cyanescens TaxID=93625 RepID=A0A409XJZ1_PSICY|nr:hypothetical protein CVT25_013131 [Psilocybe cyanescens]